MNRLELVHLEALGGLVDVAGRFGSALSRLRVARVPSRHVPLGDFMIARRP